MSIFQNSMSIFQKSLSIESKERNEQKTTMKAMTRQQIAYYAGVSVKTLNNWCKPYREELQAMGMTRSMVVLSPRIVEWLAEKFCIDID